VQSLGLAFDVGHRVVGLKSHGEETWIALNAGFTLHHGPDESGPNAMVHLQPVGDSGGERRLTRTRSPPDEKDGLSRLRRGEAIQKRPLLESSRPRSVMGGILSANFEASFPRPSGTFALVGRADGQLDRMSSASGMSFLLDEFGIEAGPVSDSR
jgi:hypothetical protein